VSGQPPRDPALRGPGENDLARRFLAAAAARTPANRRDWGRAMLAELDQVTGRRARWLFALGAARTALVPPRSSRRAAILLAAIAAVAALAIHMAVPQAGAVALVALPGLPALCAWAALARPRPACPPSAPGRAAQVIAVASIIACPALGIRLVTLYPGNSGPTGLPGQVGIVLFAAEIAAYLVLVLRRPEPLGAGRGSGLLGSAAAMVTGGVYLYSRLDNQPGPSAFTHLTPSTVTLFGGATVGVVLAAVFVPLAAGALAALPGMIRHTGIEEWLHRGAAEAMWAALLSGPAMFIVCLLTIQRAAIVGEGAAPANISLAHQQGATSVLAWVASEDFGGAIILLTGVSFAIMVTFLIMHGCFLPDRSGMPVGEEMADQQRA
jgi:hypothetical protein